LIFTVEVEPADDDQLAFTIEVEADPFRAEAQAQTQRFLEPDERHAVLAENRVEALRSDRQHVGQCGEARFIIAHGRARAFGRGGVDRSAEIAPRTDAGRHRHNRVLEGFLVFGHRRFYTTAWN